MTDRSQNLSSSATSRRLSEPGGAHGFTGHTLGHVICMPGKRPEIYERFAAEYIADLHSGAADIQRPTPRVSGEPLEGNPLAC